MGNYASSCSFIVVSIAKSNKPARVVFPSGEIRVVQEPTKVAEVMLECPGFFLVNARTLTINRCFTPLLADEDLEMGNVYVMFPMRRVNSMVTPTDMGVFWMTGGNTRKQILTTDGGGGGVGGSEVNVVEQPRLVVDVPEFSYRLAVCRSRKPVLDTIMEEPVCVKYRMVNWI
ncbi:uncharacterized protein LOC143590723 [Bidens hawaiensis]|uniref:uncharacterized protein LOC143590723 n=1 Tax=Bidens hawaiensis TaxID=980011 RepID=UPI00404A1073